MPEEHAALILLCGRSFAGKSTVAQRVAAEFGLQIVSLDAINDERGLSGGQGIPLEEWIRTNDKAVRRVASALAQGGQVVVDDTGSPRFLRDRWRAVAATAGASFALVYVDTPAAVARDRLLQNRESATRGDVTDAVMTAHLASFEPPGADEPHFTTSSLGDDLLALVGAMREQLGRAGEIS